MSGTKTSTFKVGLIAMRSGCDPQANLSAVLCGDRPGQTRRRRLRADAGNDQRA